MSKLKGLSLLTVGFLLFAGFIVGLRFHNESDRIITYADPLPQKDQLVRNLLTGEDEIVSAAPTVKTQEKTEAAPMVKVESIKAMPKQWDSTPAPNLSDEGVVVSKELQRSLEYSQSVATEKFTDPNSEYNYQSAKQFRVMQAKREGK